MCKKDEISAFDGGDRIRRKKYMELLKIRRAIIEAKKTCCTEEELEDYLGTKYEKISNIKGKGYENKYNLIVILSATALYPKRFTVTNTFGGREKIELSILKPKEYDEYMILLFGTQENRITRIEIYSCGKVSQKN